jgi:PAS domain S-box-containing protein
MRTFLKAIVLRMQPRLLEFRLVHKDGHVIHLMSRPTRLVVDGKTIGFQAIIIDITERKKMYQQLRESEAKYRELFETSVDGIATSDMDGRFTDCNQACQRMLGYSLDEMKKLTYQQLTPEKWHKMETKIIQEQTLKKGFTVEYEKEIIRKDGTMIPVSNRAWATFDENGKPKAMWGIVRDITERKRTEESFRDRALLASLVESSDDAIIGKTLDGVIVSWNSGAQKTYGYAAEDVIGKHVSILVPPEIQDDVTKFLDSIKRGEHVDRYRTVRVRKDGSRIDVSITVSPIKDANGKIIGASTIARDITERKRMENELRESEEKYRVLSENMPCIVYSTLPDEAATTSFISDRIEELTGYSVQQFFKDPKLWNRLVHPGDRERVWKKMEEHRKNETRFCEEYRIIARDGEVRWVKDKAVPVKDEQGKGTKFVGLTEDITDLKNKESELTRLNEKLRVVGGLTRHDVRNKLSAIVGNTYLARRAPDRRKETLEYLQEIDQEVHQGI